MYFAAPLWLLGLIPWAGVVVWTLRGSGNVVGVPFVELWRGPLRASSRQRRMRPPSAAVLLMLIGIGVAIVGAGKPHVRLGTWNEPITIIVDRGATMMPPQRLDDALAGTNRQLLATFASDSPVKLIAVPGGEVMQMALADWITAARQLPPVALSSQGQIDQIIEGEARKGERLLVVVSDQDLKTNGHRPIQFFPTPIQNDVGITAIAGAAGAHPQVMVRLRNLSDQTRAVLKIQTAGHVVTKEVPLPEYGAERTNFIGLPHLGDVVDASIAPGDDFPLDDRAWIVREQVNPRIELGAGLPPEVRRVVEAYLKTNRPDQNAPAVMVSATTLRDNQAGVVAEADRRPLGRPSRIELRASPVTANLSIANLDDVSIGQLPPGPGWVIVASADDVPLIATREEPARQAWVGFRSAEFATTPEFVVLWTNVLDYLRGDGERYGSGSPAALTTDWKPLAGEPPANALAGLWPGVYRRTDGALWAANMPEVPLLRSIPADAAQITGRLGRAGAVDLTWAAAVGALVCLLAAALLWPAHRIARKALPVAT